MTSDIRKRLAVQTEKLRLVCDPASISGSQPAGPGQESAMDSIDLGLKMSDGDYARSHYNVVVVGPPNTGRTAKTLDHLRRHAAGIEAAPPDAICLHDFASPRRPSIIFVPNGSGREIKRLLAELGQKAAGALPLAVWPSGSSAA